MSLDTLLYFLWDVFQSPLTWAAALVTCSGVAFALLGAFARFGKQPDNKP